MEEWAARRDALRQAATAPGADLGSLLDAALTELDGVIEAAAAAGNQGAEGVPETLRAQLHHDRHEYEAVWRELLAAAQACGALAPGIDPSAARLFILGALNWSLEWYDANKGGPSPLTPSLLAAFTR
mgnify:CR=1 FL=1